MTTEVIFSGILILLVSFAAMLVKKEFYLPLIIILLLLVVSDVNPVLRMVINLVSIGYLIWVFLIKYELRIADYPSVPKEMIIFIFAYFFSLFISTIFSVNPTESLKQGARAAAFFLFLYLIWSQMENISVIKLLFGALISASTFTSLVVFFNFIVSPETVFNVEQNVLNRTPGIYSNVNAMGGLYITSMIILLSVIASGYLKKYNLLFLGLFILNAAGLILNNSRSAILGVAAGSLFILFRLRQKYLLILLSAAAGIALLILISPAIMNLLDFYFRIERTVSGRDFFWDMAVRMFSDHWLTGIGPAGYKYQMYNYLPVMMGSWDEAVIYNYYMVTDFGLQHNFYLFVLSELGVIGFCVITYFFVICFRKAAIFLKSSQAEVRLIGLIAAAAAAGLLFRGFFESLNILSYGWLSGDLPFWIVVLSLFSVGKLLPHKLND